MRTATKNLLFLLASSSLLFVINIIALKANLYWTTSWADIISHTLGGVVVGSFCMTVRQFKSFIGLKHVFVFALAVGILWEIFELYTGLTAFSDPGFLIDTVGDIIFDVLGSFLAYAFLK